MNNENFESKYKQLISHAPLEEILDLFEYKKKKSSNKIVAFFQNLKDKFTNDNASKFIELGYNNFSSFIFFRKIFQLTLDSEREDVMEYFFNNNYSSVVEYNFDIADLVVSPKVLKKVLSNKNIKKRLTSYSYYMMLEKAAWKNMPESIEIIMQSDAKKIQGIKKHLQEKIILQAVAFNANESFFKLIKTKEPIQFNINLKQDSEENDDERTNILLLAVKNNNKTILNYILTSPEIEVHANLVENISWIKKLDNAEEIFNMIVFDIRAPLTEELRIYLKDDVLLNLFEKRDLMSDINKKLPLKGIKLKSQKI